MTVFYENFIICIIHNKRSYNEFWIFFVFSHIYNSYFKQYTSSKSLSNTNKNHQHKFGDFCYDPLWMRFRQVCLTLMFVWMGRLAIIDIVITDGEQNCCFWFCVFVPKYNSYPIIYVKAILLFEFALQFMNFQ